MDTVWKKVGKVKSPHGLRGDLYIFVFSKDVSWLKKLKQFCLAKGDDPHLGKTYEVEAIKTFKEGLMLKPKGVSTRNDSDLLQGQMFFIPEDLLISQKGETVFLRELQGFSVTNAQEEVLAVVIGFSSNGVQDLLVVETSQSQKAEIPFVEDFILDIDFEKRRIQMELPPGLLDLESLP